MVAMSAIAVLLVLLVAGVAAYLIRQRSEPPAVSDLDPEQEMKAAVELHRIRTNLDVAWTRSEQRRAGAALRREIRKALEGDDE